MYIEEFMFECYQFFYENEVDINLIESGVYFYMMCELFLQEEFDEVFDVCLGYGWINGNFVLCEVIVQYYLGVMVDNVFVINGLVELNFLYMWICFEFGDEVVVMVFNYLQIWGIVCLMDCEVKSFFFDEKCDWVFNFDEFCDKVIDVMKFIVVCNLNNLMGVVLLCEDMEMIVQIVEDYDVDIYLDEVYKGVEFDGLEGLSFWDVIDCVMVVVGLFKVFVYLGLCIGWFVGSEEFIVQVWCCNDYMMIIMSLFFEVIVMIIFEFVCCEQILECNCSFLC